jgi:hypothetical protein
MLSILYVHQVERVWKCGGYADDHLGEERPVGLLFDRLGYKHALFAWVSKFLLEEMFLFFWICGLGVCDVVGRENGYVCSDVNVALV